MPLARGRGELTGPVLEPRPYTVIMSELPPYPLY